MKTPVLSGLGEKLGTARSVHAAKGAPWDRLGCPQFFAGSHSQARAFPYNTSNRLHAFSACGSL